MVNPESLGVASIGHCASEIINAQNGASIIGMTSRGIFLRTPKNNILFITADRFRGPLTVNVPSFDSVKERLSQDEKVAFSEGHIIFKSSSLTLQPGNDTVIWEPLHLHRTPLNVAPFRARLYQVRSDIPDWDPNIILNLTVVFLRNCAEDMIGLLEAFIGKGEGLTPSGDDFICGFLLVLSTWNKLLFPIFPREELSERISDLAAQRTTALSANLIACAGRGSADERIINLMAWLHTGFGNYSQVMKELHGYGSSSGLDTLRGIIAALECGGMK